MDTLTAPVPDAGLNRKIAPRNLGMEFGDGYGSVTPDGLNTMLMEIEPKWSIISFEQMDELDEFFRTQHGKSFLWKLPREPAPRVWRCSEWAPVEGQTTGEITAKFKEQPT